MGDKTSVTLTISNTDYEKYKDSIDGLTEYSDIQNNIDKNKTYLTYYDINYANLEFEQELIANKIPYDKDWDAGSEYSSGSEYYRITEDGKDVVKGFSGDTEKTVVLEDLIKAQSEHRVNQFIADMIKEKQIISWDEQLKILTKLEEAKQ